MALLPDVGVYLAAAGLSLTVGTNLFYGRLPDGPDKCVAIYESNGTIPIETMSDNTEPPVVHPGLQVLARDGSYADAQTLAEDVWQKLTLVSNETLSSTRYLRVAPVQQPAPIERDSQDRVLFSCNFDVLKAL
jgi:hypothetical protein